MSARPSPFRHQVRLVQPSAEVTDLPGGIHRRGRLACHEIGLHARQHQQESMHPALPDTLKQMFGTAEPTHALRLVASRNVEDPETEGNPRGVGRTGFGNKGVARRSVES
jgi:hypothetical protein